MWRNNPAHGGWPDLCCPCETYAHQTTEKACLQDYRLEEGLQESSDFTASNERLLHRCFLPRRRGPTGRIGVVIFGLHWTVYFNDYFLVAKVFEAKHVDMAQQLLFMVLGWQTSDEKEGGFNSTSRIIGVKIDVADAHMGAATISNVESRVRELVATIDEILARGTISTAEMMVLRGRLVLIYGRLAGSHMRHETTGKVRGWAETGPGRCWACLPSVHRRLFWGRYWRTWWCSFWWDWQCAVIPFWETGCRRHWTP